MPRKRLEVTEKDRGTVEAMASYGIPQDDIARVIKCSEKTLRKYFEAELQLGSIKSNAKVAEMLFRATQTTDEKGQPDPRHNAARMFWLKTRAGWRERDKLEVVGDEGGPIDVRVTYDAADGIPD